MLVMTHAMADGLIGIVRVYVQKLQSVREPELISNTTSIAVAYLV